MCDPGGQLPERRKFLGLDQAVLGEAKLDQSAFGVVAREADFTDQARILHRNDRLCGEAFQKRDLLLWKDAWVGPEDPDKPDDLPVPQERHLKQCPHTAELNQRVA